MRVRFLPPLPIFLFYEVIFISTFFSKLFISLLFIVIFISVFFIPIIQNYPNSYYYENNINSDLITLNPDGFIWPIPGYTRISSHFGKRNAPTAGASTFHKGCDIPAPPGTNLIATIDGTITFTGFLGGGGYTITLSSDNLKITYCHTSPNYIVKTGDIVKQGQIIGHVGPKNVYNVPGNTYKDPDGNPTNGATTGPHLHLGFRINNEYVNPLDYF